MNGAGLVPVGGAHGLLACTSAFAVTVSWLSAGGSLGWRGSILTCFSLCLHSVLCFITLDAALRLMWVLGFLVSLCFIYAFPLMTMQDLPGSTSKLDSSSRPGPQASLSCSAQPSVTSFLSELLPSCAQRCSGGHHPRAVFLDPSLSHLWMQSLPLSLEIGALQPPNFFWKVL